MPVSCCWYINYLHAFQLFTLVLCCRYINYLHAFQLFMLFWITNFVVALGQMTLSGAFASYYWAFRKPKDIPLFPVSASLRRSLRYR